MVQTIKVAHPLKTRTIAEARIKTDKLDAETLAHLLRCDLIAEAYAPKSETRSKRGLVRHRAFLCKMRTMLKNCVHALLARNHIEDYGFRKLSDKVGRSGMAYLRSLELRGNDMQILNNYLDLIEEINEKMRTVERQISDVYEADEVSRLLDTVPGIGRVLSVLMRYEIDDIKRFSSAKKLCAYAGLVPSTYSSGGKTYHGKITKQGNRWLRWALVEAAQRAVVKDLWLRRYYNRVAKRGGTRRAKVAVARKLLEIIYKMWNYKRPYYEKPMAVALYKS